MPWVELANGIEVGLLEKQLGALLDCLARCLNDIFALVLAR